MIKIRAGWEHLISAQILWVASTAISGRRHLRVHVSEADPRIEWAQDMTLQWTLGIDMDRMRSLALLVAQHTCEVCGAPTLPDDGLPVRCTEHTKTRFPTVKIDVAHIMDVPCTGRAFAELASQNIDLLFIGNVDMASAQLQAHDDLFCAAFARHECSFLGDPFAPAIANVLVRVLQEMPARKWFGRNQVEAAVNEPDATQQLSSSPGLLAAAKIWAQYGYTDLNLKLSCREAIARYDAWQAGQAIQNMMKALRK